MQATLQNESIEEKTEEGENLSNSVIIKEDKNSDILTNQLYENNYDEEINEEDL